MRRALSMALLGAAVASLGACDEDTPTTCAAPEGTSATCDEACTKLFDLDCRVGADVAECVATCTAQAASLGPAVSGRVQACYAQATSCAEVDGCSLTCGPGGGPVPFVRADGGSAPLDAGEGMDAGEGLDAGGSAVDAGGSPVDAGNDAGGADDAGSPGTDAGAPAVDAG